MTPKCKYCECPLTNADMKKSRSACGKCRHKLVYVRRFIEVCNDLKHRLGVLPEEETKR